MRATDPEAPLARGHTVALLQGVYYAVTGFWPVLHLSSFEWFTGRKTDGWLVKTVGAMLGIDGLALLLARRGSPIAPEVAVVGAGTASVLGGVDLVYYHRGILRAVYLLDAVVEIALVIGWLTHLRPSANGIGTHPAPQEAA